MFGQELLKTVRFLLHWCQSGWYNIMRISCYNELTSYIDNDIITAMWGTVTLPNLDSKFSNWWIGRRQIGQYNTQILCQQNPSYWFVKEEWRIIWYISSRLLLFKDKRWTTITLMLLKLGIKFERNRI